MAKRKKPRPLGGVFTDAVTLQPFLEPIREFHKT
jgi:hypothetical protein